MALAEFYKRKDIRALLHRCEKLRNAIQAEEGRDEDDLEEFLVLKGTILALRAEVDSRPITMRALKGEVGKTPEHITQRRKLRRELGSSYTTYRRQQALLKMGYKAEQIAGQVDAIWEAKEGEKLARRDEKPKRSTMGRPRAGVAPAVQEAIKGWEPLPLSWD